MRVFEKASPGRDKVCGDGLTPRAVTALAELGIGLEGRPPHRRAADDRRRHPPGAALAERRALRRARSGLAAPLSSTSTSPTQPRQAGAEIIWDTEAAPVLDDDGAVIGVADIQTGDISTAPTWWRCQAEHPDAPPGCSEPNA